MRVDTSQDNAQSQFEFVTSPRFFSASPVNESCLFYVPTEDMQGCSLLTLSEQLLIHLSGKLK